MAGVIASKTGFYLFYIFLFTIGIIYAASFAQTEGVYNTKIKETEDSVVVNRVVKCFSEEGSLGLIDQAKVDENNLKKCFGENKYGFKIKLVSSKGKDKEVEMGELKEARQVYRYVLVNEEGYRGARLEVGYSKNAA